MNLIDIMMEFARVENDLADGEIDFSYGKLTSVMKPGHPADIMDDIFQPVGDAVYLYGEKAVSREQLKEFYDSMVEFQNAFSIKELDEPLCHLKNYLE